MYTEGFEQWLKTASKNFSAPIGDIQKTNAEMWRHIMADNLEMASDNLLRLSDQLKRLSQIKKPEDYLNLARECLNENINATVENSQKLLHNVMGHLEECARSSTHVQENAIKESAIKTEHKVREREK